MAGGGQSQWETKARSRFGGIFNKYEIKASPDIKCSRNGGNWGKNYENKANHWDIAPPPEYFEELFRISKNQIIWGGNYFALPPTRCFVVWKKLTISENFTMAMCEYAWTSFNDNAKIFEFAPQDKDRFHPTQKPVGLYLKLLNNYAKPGDKILDTHAGSASLPIACIKAGFDWTAFEIDEGYYIKAQKRILDERAQISMFD
jgi:site-specific DNA-methyltransferase (adenine-specific)